ncbi:MAG: bifunctional pyr operon transcriptional regulator/uracil phosphoribosyltransferase PyrR [Verrucomicrobiae bacterium]|nr:bifunctional pyr operon transcriptional regulator/uracil phosphoribosyltransferase PyrR [Verrucomicrobiae bacterium]
MTDPLLPPRLLLSGSQVSSAMDRLARSIADAHPAGNGVVLVGVQTGGVQVARHLARNLEALWSRAVPLGHLDVSMHRDDLDRRLAPAVHPTWLPFELEGHTVVLVDDVFCSGRTIRAALDALTDLGRPNRVELAVLIERRHHELPIHANFVGQAVDTEPRDRVEVEFDAEGNANRVLLEPGGPA